MIYDFRPGNKTICPVFDEDSEYSGPRTSNLSLDQVVLGKAYPITMCCLLSLFLISCSLTNTGGGFCSSLFLGGGHVLIKLRDSRHIQVAVYTVFDEESEFQIKNSQILEPGGKT